MGDVFAKITLRNGGDIVLAQRGHIPQQDIRSLTVTALVDTGARTLVMGEALREQLGLVLVDTHAITVGGGLPATCGITEPVEVCWEDRTASVRAWVLPGEENVLLGVIPLEEMDLIVDPLSEQLTRPTRHRLASGLVRERRPDSEAMYEKQ